MIINTIPTTQCQPQTIVIGRRGTYDTLQIAFDLSFLIENYGSGTAVLAVKRSQDTSAYPAVVTQDGSTLTWTISETDTYYVGAGECQLMWYVDGGLAKTIIYPMVVMRDILSTAEEPPDGYENWIESLTALGAATQQNAQNAAQSASDAEDAKDDAVTAKEAAEAAQQAAETAVTHYPTIQNNYWMVWDSVTQQYVSTGIQAEGEDGYSPEVTITTITGGHRVTITDKDHPQGQSFDVMDGQGGGGSSDYTDLTNKPSINNVTLTGNKTAADLGLATPSDIPTVPVQSVNGKTGAVVLSASDVGAKPDSYTAPVSSVNTKTGAVTLDAGDLEFDDQETYASGTVGKTLSDELNAIDQIEEATEIQFFGVNLFDPSDPDVLRGKYYDGNTLKTAAALGQSGYIPAEVGHYYTSNQRDVFVQLYDSTKTFVSKYRSDDFIALGYVQIPADIAYARFIFLTAAENTFKIWETNASGADSPTIPFLKQETIGASGINLRFIAGAVRKSSADSDWGLINDSGHVPLNLASVSVDASGNLVVMYSFTAKRVIALEVTPDETFANSYVAGASVGGDRATITFYSTQTHTKVNANDIYNAYGNFWIYGVMDA